MNKIRKRVLIIIMALSISLNMFFVYDHYQEQNRKKYELTDAVDQVIFYINQATNRLTGIRENDPDFNRFLIEAIRDIATSKGWIRAYAPDMPPNLVSWIGGIEVGLPYGSNGIDDEIFNSTVQSLENFNNGLIVEIHSMDLSHNPVERVKVIENVLSSKKYMGEHYVTK